MLEPVENIPVGFQNMDKFLPDALRDNAVLAVFHLIHPLNLADGARLELACGVNHGGFLDHCITSYTNHPLKYGGKCRI